MSTTLRGGCHCGCLVLRFEVAGALADLQVRICTCGFCRKHGHRWTSDPRGKAEIGVCAPDTLQRYRFATGTAEFLLCRRCGVCVAAVDGDGGDTWAVLNVNALQGAERLSGEPVPVSYDAETVQARRARRRERWTPVTVVLAGNLAD